MATWMLLGQARVRLTVQPPAIELRSQTRGNQSRTLLPSPPVKKLPLPRGSITAASRPGKKAGIAGHSHTFAENRSVVSTIENHVGAV